MDYCYWVQKFQVTYRFLSCLFAFSKLQNTSILGARLLFGKGYDYERPELSGLEPHKPVWRDQLDFLDVVGQNNLWYDPCPQSLSLLASLLSLL